MTPSLLVVAALAAAAQGRGLESLWYLRGEEGIQAFLAHADQISIVSPQVFVIDSNGVITGSVDSYDRWIHHNWRAGFDYKALADTLDFISYMTYAQHTGGSPPGPVAGYPWMLACLEYLLALGVPPGKISLGLAGYSDWWYPSYDEREGARLRGSDISYARGMELLQAAGAKATWDSVQLAPYAMWESQGVFQHLWLEDARAFMAKRELVVRRGLRGYSVWLLGSEDPAVWPALRKASPTHR